MGRRVWVLLGSLLLLAFSTAARAQEDAVELEVPPVQIGLGGTLRPGGWTPALLTLRNRSAQSRVVRCEWWLKDIDGDRLVAQREATLSPQRTQGVWLYAPVRVNVDRERPRWRAQVVDQETGRLLAGQPIAPAGPQWVEPASNVVGVFGSARMGLRAYEEPLTQHEPLVFLQGLRAVDLPDRWYGLSLASSLIWTPDAGDPGDASVSAEARGALRQWVQRGGHLVVVLPAVGETWTSSPLADLLPPVRVERAAQKVLPWWLGQPLPDELELPAQALFPTDESVSVLLRDRQERPLVVAHRVGFGRVTLVGLDITATALQRAGLPSGPTLWGTIFGWRSPAYGRGFLEGQSQQVQLVNPEWRQSVELGRFLPPLVAMRDTVAGAVLAAVVLFGIYWLAAGPAGYGLLKHKGMTRHAWVVFAGVVLVFSAVAWGAAMLARPLESRVAHFSVLDIDAQTGHRHVRSWVSLFVPEHGRSQITLGEQGEQTAPATIASVGLLAGEPTAEFPDSQEYQLPAGDPDSTALPMRSTAKQLTLDYLDRRPFAQQRQWVMPEGPVRTLGGWPTATLSHQLPGPMHYTWAVYCPGDGKTPWVYPVHEGAWQPGTPVKLPMGNGQNAPPPKAQRLVVPPSSYLSEKRGFTNEGYLGGLISLRTGWRQEEQATQAMREIRSIADNQVFQAAHMLSFFEALPPPALVAEGGTLGMSERNLVYHRQLGRELDLTHLTATRCLILIGLVKDSPTPAPLRVDGREVAGQGFTLVRWISPVTPDAAAATP